MVSKLARSFAALAFIGWSATPALAQEIVPLSGYSERYALMKARFDEVKARERQLVDERQRVLDRIAQLNDSPLLTTPQSDLAQLRVEVDLELKRLELQRLEAWRAERRADDADQMIPIARNLDEWKPGDRVAYWTRERDRASAAFPFLRDEVEAAEAMLGIGPKLDPSGNYARAVRAQAYLTQVEKDIALLEPEVAAAAFAYLREAEQNAPPLLDEVTITFGSGVHYSARLEARSDPGLAGVGEELQLLSLETELTGRLAELEPLRRQSYERRQATIARMLELQPVLEGFAADADWWRHAGIAAAIIIESGFTIYDVAGTGGLSTAATVGAALGEFAVGVGAGAAPKGAAFLVDYIPDKLSNDPPEPGPIEGKSATTGEILKRNLKVPLGEAIEEGFAIPIKGELIKTVATSDLVFDGNKATRVLGSRRVVNLEGIKSLSAALVAEAAIKYVAAVYIDAKADEADLQFVRVVVEAGALAQQFDKERQMSRAVDEEYRDLVLALASLKLRKASRRARQVDIDRAADSFALANGGRIQLHFTAPVDRPPVVRVGGTAVTGLVKIGIDGSRWEGVIPPIRNFTGTSAPISVSLAKGALPYEVLDSAPDTPMQLDVERLGWTGVEPGADTNHRLKLRASGGLDGTWREFDTIRFRIEQSGDEVVGYWLINNPDYAYNVGDRFLIAKRRGNRLVGQRLLRPLRSRYQECKVERWVSFDFEISSVDDRLSGPLEGLIVDDRCRVALSPPGHIVYRKDKAPQ